MSRHPRETALSADAVAEDLRRAIISALLRRRTWDSEDLARTMTVAEVAAALVGRAARDDPA